MVAAASPAALSASLPSLHSGLSLGIDFLVLAFFFAVLAYRRERKKNKGNRKLRYRFLISSDSATARIMSFTRYSFFLASVSIALMSS